MLFGVFEIRNAVENRAPVHSDSLRLASAASTLPAPKIGFVTMTISFPWAALRSLASAVTALPDGSRRG